MKSTFNIFFVFIFVFGCSTSDHSVEDNLYNCLIDEYKSKGIDLVPLLDSLENHYINLGILDDKSGQAKLEFYKKIAATGEVPKMNTYSIADRVAKIKFFQDEIESCLLTNSIDSITLSKSKYHQLMEASKVMEEINPKNAAIAHTRVLTGSDFEHPYFRAHMLISYTRIYEHEFSRKIPVKKRLTSV
jgi:hypothetical protein